MSVDPDPIQDRQKTVSPDELKMLDVDDEETSEMAEVATLGEELEEML